MLKFSNIKFLGHPIIIFSENKKKIIKRFFLTNFLKNKKLNQKNKNHKKTNLYTFCKIYPPFFNFEIRKKRFEINAKFFEIKKSNYKIKILTQPLPELASYSKINGGKNNFLKFQKNKKTFFQKKVVSSYCFLSQENFLATNSSQKKIEIIKIGERNPFFKIKYKKFDISNMSNPNINSNIFETSGNYQTKLWRICPEIGKFQIFSLKHNSFLNFSNFRNEENVIDFCFLKKKWKSFDIESEKWLLNQCFSEEIISIEKNENKPVFAILTPEKIRIFDSRLGKTVISIESDEKKIFSIKWNKGVSKIFSCGASKNAVLWDLRFFNKKQKCLNHQDYLTDVTSHLNSKVIFTNSYDKITKMWCKKKLTLLKNIFSHENKILKNKMSLNGYFLACLDEKKLLKIFFDF